MILETQDDRALARGETQDDCALARGETQDDCALARGETQDDCALARGETQDDCALVRSYVRHGATAAFAELTRRHRDFVYSVCLRELGDRQWAEDATQVAFLVLARRAATIRAGVPVRSWLFSVARLCARDVRKREMRHVAALQDRFPADCGRSPQAVTPMDEELDAALERLRPADRELVLRRFVDGASFAEAARGIGISEEAARKRVVRSLAKLRRSLAHLQPLSTESSVAASLGALVVPSPPALAHRLESMAASGATGLISAVLSSSVSALARDVVAAMRLAQAKFLAAGVAAGVVGGAAMRAAVHGRPDAPVHAARRIARALPPRAAASDDVRARYGERLESVSDVLAPDLNPLASPQAREKQIAAILKRDLVERDEPKGFTITITATLRKPMVPPSLPGADITTPAGTEGAGSPVLPEPGGQRGNSTDRS